jgi:DivIVA domain-containing protein
MLIVFAVAALAVLIVIAYLATGRGGGLGALPDEEVDFRLPPPPLSPSDVKAVRFGRAVRGYRVDHVDQLIALVAAELATRDARIGELERKLQADRRTTVAAPVTPDPRASPPQPSGRDGGHEAARSSVEPTASE